MTLRNLGQIAGLFLQELRASYEGHDDVRAFGAPGECHASVNRAYKNSLNDLLVTIERQTGYTFDELAVEFETRLSPKWLWASGLTNVLDDLAQAREDDERVRTRLKQSNQARLPGGMSGADIARQQMADQYISQYLTRLLRVA